MPWKPAAVGKKTTPYDARWQRLRAQKLSSEPLCRLCLAAGRTVPAVIVDHIVPLADGGTHDIANLQPMCKRCHDSVKTPADVAARERAKTVGLAIVAVDFGIHFRGSGVLDQRIIRRAFAAGMGWQTAHTVSIAAMMGIVTAAQRGDLPRLTGVLVTDDAQWARAAAIMLGTSATIQPMSDAIPNGPPGTEDAWLRERYGSEYSQRHGTDTTGSQPASSR